MTKRRQDFEAWAGKDRRLRYTITGSDSAAYDLTGASIGWVLEEEPPSSGSLVKKSTGDGYITISTSTVTVILSGSDTANLAGIYYHQLSASDSASLSDMLAVGKVVIQKSGV